MVCVLLEFESSFPLDTLRFTSQIWTDDEAWASPLHMHCLTRSSPFVARTHPQWLVLSCVDNGSRGKNKNRRQKGLFAFHSTLTTPLLPFGHWPRDWFQHLTSHCQWLCVRLSQWGGFEQKRFQGALLTSWWKNASGKHGKQAVLWKETHLRPCLDWVTSLTFALPRWDAQKYLIGKLEFHKESWLWMLTNLLRNWTERRLHKWLCGMWRE